MQPQAAVTSQHHEENIAENAYTQKTCQSSYETCQRRAERKASGGGAGEAQRAKANPGAKQRGEGRGGADPHKLAESLTYHTHGSKHLSIKNLP